VHREIYFKPKNSKATLPTQTTCPLALMAGAEVDAMDFEPEEDDLMEDDTIMDDGNAEIVPTPAPKLKSTITGNASRLDDGSPDNTKRRSFRKETDVEHNSHFAARK
jgi:RNA-binding protein 8A